MTGVLYATITGNVGAYAFTCNVTVQAADQTTAQTELDAIKAWFVSGGATNLIATGNWQPQTQSLTA